MNYKAESLNRLAFPLKFGDRPCCIYGTDCAEYLLLQMTGEHELQSMDSEVAAIAQGTLRFLTEQAIPTLKQQFALPENVRIILGGYSLAGLFALWASTQTALFSGVAAASPSVWFPGWMEFEQQHTIQAQRVYLSLGDREERTRNSRLRSNEVPSGDFKRQDGLASARWRGLTPTSSTMAAVGDNIRALHRELVERGKNCTLEWNNGGHFKDADLRTARAFRWAMEDMR